ncbi:WXG100 family type VII secretion target [Streptomyces sp. NPDC006992]|uniref:WXG100 family type VII secretion target n=1 Tax=Streptomyces sp. NPDC006992 TaxID=3155601 RepID=UPI00340535EE
MGDKQNVDDKTLKSLANELEEMMGAITGRVTRLNQLIDNLEGAWQGVAKGAFDRVQRGMNDDLRVQRRIMEGFVGSIHGNLGIKDSNEDDIVQSMNKLGSGENPQHFSATGPDTTQGSLAGAYSSKLSQM